MRTCQMSNPTKKIFYLQISQPKIRRARRKKYKETKKIKKENNRESNCVASKFGVASKYAVCS